MADKPDTWHRGLDEDKPSYLGEMLLSQTNINLGLATLAGAAVAAIPLGLAGAAIPLVLFGAGEAIASMFVPSSSGARSASLLSPSLLLVTSAWITGSFGVFQFAATSI